MTDLDFEKRICEDEMAFGRKWVEERLEKVSKQTNHKPDEVKK